MIRLKVPKLSNINGTQPYIYSIKLLIFVTKKKTKTLFLTSQLTQNGPQL